MKRKLKLISVLRDSASRMFQVNLASKAGKAEFMHCGGTIGGRPEFTFFSRITNRYYHIQSNYCVIVYEQV